MRLTDARKQIIENRARYLQLELWNIRDQLWSRDVPTNPIEALEPGVALRHIGVDLETCATLGEDWIQGKRSEVAGIFDYVNNKVLVSARFSYEIQRFTLAHELGHAILHPGQGTMHRDLPANEFGYRRDIKELEADYFASCFLMPEKQLRRIFKQKFGVDTFVLNEDSAFLLGCGALDNAQKRYGTLRARSRALAEAVSYGGRITSLKSSFGVSTTAMAIRLEELKLVA